jgi:hypothetical protein
MYFQRDNHRNSRILKRISGKKTILALAAKDGLFTILPLLEARLSCSGFLVQALLLSPFLLTPSPKGFSARMKAVQPFFGACSPSFPPVLDAVNEQQDTVL